MKKLIMASLLSLVTAVSAQADVVITKWTFEGDVITPEIGTGTASLVGGTTATFANGNGGGRGWNTTTYADQGTGSGERGVAFFTSTLGLKDIVIEFDHRASGTASRWAQLDYTIDGGNSWVTGVWNNNGGLSPHDTFYSFEVNLSGITEVNNQAGFGFRIVSIFSPVAFEQNATLSYGANEAYMRANAQAGFDVGSGVGTGNYGTTGTWRFDNVTISAVPEPTSMALLGVVGLGGLVVRRFRKKQKSSSETVAA